MNKALSFRALGGFVGVCGWNVVWELKTGGFWLIRIANKSVGLKSGSAFRRAEMGVCDWVLSCVDSGMPEGA